MRRLLLAAAMGAIYFITAFAAVAMTRFDGGVAFIWVASALLLARLALMPVRRWAPTLIACALAQVVVSATVGIGLKAAPLMGAATLVEAMVGALMLQRLKGNSCFFESVKGVAIFMLVAGGAAPLLSGLVGAAAASMVTDVAFRTNLINWFAAHGLGAITFAPLAVMVIRGDLSEWIGENGGRRRIEALVLLAVVTLTVAAVFDQERAPLLFLPMLPMMVATIRCGRLGAAMSTVITITVGGALTLGGHGPVHLMVAAPGVRAQFFQFYVACAVLLVLPVAALLKQRMALVVRLSESEAKYRLIAERSSDAILNIAADGVIGYVSPSITELAGYAPVELIGRGALDIVSAGDRDAVRSVHRAALTQPASSHGVDFRAILADGSERWFEMRTRAVTAEDGQSVGVVSALRDVSERKAHESELAAAANTDPLTGLANRRALLAALESRLRDVRNGTGEGSIAIFDLDRFKSINDRFGHAAGDKVLEGFAAVARRTLRAGDCIGRIGGEEFAAILWNAGPDEARFVCERLRRALRETVFQVEAGGVLRVTASAGVTAIDPDQSAPALLELADRALYAAKEAGRDCLKQAA